MITNQLLYQLSYRSMVRYFTARHRSRRRRQRCSSSCSGQSKVGSMQCSGEPAPQADVKADVLTLKAAAQGSDHQGMLARIGKTYEAAKQPFIGAFDSPVVYGTKRTAHLDQGVADFRYGGLGGWLVEIFLLHAFYGLF
jgi:hypothetical protein